MCVFRMSCMSHMNSTQHTLHCIPTLSSSLPDSGNATAGDGTIMGGIIVMRDGKIVYHAPEDLEDPFDFAEIAAAATGNVLTGKATGTFIDPADAANSSSNSASVLTQEQKDTLEVCYSPKDCA